MLDLDRSTWTRVRFGNVVKNVNETVKEPSAAGIDKVIALEHLDPGELTIARHGDIADGTTFTRRVRPGQTLFGKRRAYQRKAAYAEVDAICSGDILVFEADQKRLSPRLLPFLVHSDAFFDHALGTSAGSLSPRTSWKALAKCEFDLPPLNEQERIADLLWAVEDHSTAMAAQESAENHASSSVMETLFKRYGTVRPLSDVVRAVIDCPHSTAPSSETDYARVIGTPDVRHGLIHLDSARPVSEETYRKWITRGEPQAGDVIFTREAPAGEVGIIPQGARVCLGQRTVLLQPRSREEGDLLWAALRSTSVQRVIKVKSAGSTVPHLNVGDIRRLPIPWVEDPSDRKTLLEFISHLRQATEAMQDAMRRVEVMRAALTSSFFPEGT